MYKDIEKSIIKKYRKTIWIKFTKAINEYNLIKENDKIAICISGGKDSFLLAKCLEELKRHGKINFSLEYILMNPGYSKEHLKQIKNNCKLLNIKLNIFDYKIFDVLKENKNPCYLCARMRRGALYNKAQELGCNKIALGHHFNDVIETILLSMIYNGEFKTMKPILDSTNYKNMKLIRPLYYVKEIDIISWMKYNNLAFLDCACEVTKKNISSKREEMKDLVKQLNIIYKDADINILNSTKNVNLKTIINYKEDDK